MLYVRTDTISGLPKIYAANVADKPNFKMAATAVLDYVINVKLFFGTSAILN